MSSVHIYTIELHPNLDSAAWKHVSLVIRPVPYRPSLTAAGALRDCRASCVVARWHCICNWTEEFVFVGFEIETALLQFATMYQHHTLLQIHRVLAPAGTPFPSPSEVSYEDLSCDMTIVAINGIEDSLCPGVRHAISTCPRPTSPSGCTPEAMSSPLCRSPHNAVLFRWRCHRVLSPTLSTPRKAWRSSPISTVSP